MNAIKSRAELYNKNGKLYELLRSNDLLEEIFPHKRSKEKTIKQMLEFFRTKPSKKDVTKSKWYSRFREYCNKNSSSYSKEFQLEVQKLCPWLFLSKKAELENFFKKEKRKPNTTDDLYDNFCFYFKRKSYKYDKKTAAWIQVMTKKYPFICETQFSEKRKELDLFKPPFVKILTKSRELCDRIECEDRRYGKYSLIGFKLLKWFKKGKSGHPLERKRKILDQSFKVMLKRLPKHVKFEKNQVWKGTTHKYWFIDEQYGRFQSAANSPGHDQRRIVAVKGTICKFVKNLDTGKVFSSISEACRSIDKSTSALHSVFSGKCKTAGGYRWAYCDENGKVINGNNAKKQKGK